MIERHTTALAACGLLDRVPAEQWDGLRLDVREYEQGHVLCRSGDAGTCLWVVVRGRIDVMSGGMFIVTRTTPEVIGEMAVLRGGGTRSADLIVLDSPTELLEIPRSAIVVHPSASQIWQNVANLISSKLNHATKDRERLKADVAEKTQLLRKWVGEDALSKHLLAPEEFVGGHRRRTAVVWFSDVVGFSKMAMEVAPDRIGALVQDFLSPQVNAIRDAGGHIDKFIGDGIMAYWTVGPGEEVVCCGKALGAALESLRQVRNIPYGADRLDLRVGLHIGEVLAGNFGTPQRAQYTLVGHEVNKAARLEQAHEGKVIDGGHLAAVRVSEEFFARLPAAEQGLLPYRCIVGCKGIGDTGVLSGEDAQEEAK